MTSIPKTIIYVHGLNTANPNYSSAWTKSIMKLINNIGGNNGDFIIKSVKWKSKSWTEDLINIYMSKIYRDEQINKVKEMIINSNTEDPLMIITHSWGSVWVFKALWRLAKTNPELLSGRKIWLVFIGGALGGTNIPFAGVYIKALKEKYDTSQCPQEIERFINFYNEDDYVSTRLFAFKNKVENIKVNIPGFNPGLQEHSAIFYFETPEFENLLKEFIKKYP